MVTQSHLTSFAYSRVRLQTFLKLMEDLKTPSFTAFRQLNDENPTLFVNKLSNFQGSLILFISMITLVFKILPLLVSSLIETLHGGIGTTLRGNPSQLGAFLPNQLFDVLPTFSGLDIPTIPVRHTKSGLRSKTIMTGFGHFAFRGTTDFQQTTSTVIH